MRREKKYATEAALCAAFIEWAKPQGWTAYAETAGWDILLVDGSGRQIGVQAKLQFNLKLIHQAMPPEWHPEVGPDFRAVLVPDPSVGKYDLCDLIGITVFKPWWRGDEFAPDLSGDCLYDWNPERRCKLPAHVPDVVAGASGPVQLTDWKVKALRACAVLEVDGEITSRRIRELGMDPRRWICPRGGWLAAKPGHRGVYTRGPKLRFDRQHPDVYAQVKADLYPSAPALASAQPAAAAGRPPGRGEGAAAQFTSVSGAGVDPSGDRGSQCPTPPMHNPSRARPEIVRTGGAADNEGLEVR